MSAAVDEWWATAAQASAEQAPGDLGPARTRIAGWQLTAAELLDTCPAEVAELAASQGFVLARQQVRDAGVDAPTLRRLRRRGEWTSFRRGIFCPLPPRADGRPGNSSHEIVIASAALARGWPITHESAAVLHGLPVVNAPARVQLTAPGRSSGGGWRDCVVHSAPLPAEERDEWFGAATSSLARTIVDVARNRGVGPGLVVADAALREHLVDRAAIERSVALARRRPGVRAAARVADLADPGGHSPLESLTRLCLLRGGLPRPETQAPVVTDRGQYFVDLLFADHRVVVEADGQLKYRVDRGGRPDALWREKLRQEAIERAGYRVIRVTWDDVLFHPEAVVARVRRALPATLATG